MTTSAADALCMECGLCCDGTLFGSVIVAADEHARLGRLGLPIIDNGGALSMNQRCRALCDNLCAIYDARPAACAQYECSLRKSVLAGTKTEDQGRADITRMRALIATLGAAFDVPATSTVSVWEALLTLAEPAITDEDSESQRRQEAGVDALTELLALGRSAFEPSFSGGSWAGRCRRRTPPSRSPRPSAHGVGCKTSTTSIWNDFTSRVRRWARRSAIAIVGGRDAARGGGDDRRAVLARSAHWRGRNGRRLGRA